MPTRKPPGSALAMRSRYVSIGHRCSVLAMQGLDDRYAKIGQAKTFAEGIGSQADLCLLASCGHSPYREAPHRTLELMRQFTLNERGSMAPAATDSGNSC